MLLNCPSCNTALDLEFDDCDEYHGFCRKCGELIETSLDQLTRDRQKADQDRANNLVSSKEGRKRRYGK